MLATGDNPVAGTVTATTSAAIIGTQVCSAVLVQNDPNSSVKLLVGDATSQPFALNAGQAVTIPCSNVNKVYVKSASATAVCNWIATQ